MKGLHTDLPRFLRQYQYCLQFILGHSPGPLWSQHPCPHCVIIAIIWKESAAFLAHCFPPPHFSSHFYSLFRWVIIFTCPINCFLFPFFSQYNKLLIWHLLLFFLRPVGIGESNFLTLSVMMTWTCFHALPGPHNCWPPGPRSYQTGCLLSYGIASDPMIIWPGRHRTMPPQMAFLAHILILVILGVEYGSGIMLTYPLLRILLMCWGFGDMVSRIRWVISFWSSK